MAYAWKHNSVPPASCASCLIGIDVMTFWQCCAEAGERHYSTMYFSTGETEKANGCLGSAGIGRIFDVPFSGNGIIISKCHVDEHSPRPWFNTLQLCTAHWNVVPLCACLCVNECSPFTTVGHTAIILLWLCHVWLCACGCNSIYVCLSDFALCGSYKPIWCRVAEIQIDFTSNLSSQLPHTNTPKLKLTNGTWSQRT